MWNSIKDLYLQTRKPGEHPWTMYCTRPFAAAIVLLLKNTRITPNQVTLSAFLTSLIGAAVLLGWQTWAGLIVGAFIYQIAYILDCVDGQLARVRKTSSPVGHLLDFMMDEAKAKIFFGAVALRLYFIHHNITYAVLGVAGVALLSIALSLTTFLRRPEVSPPTPQPTHEDTPASTPPKSLIGTVLRLVERTAQNLMNYPTYVPLLALFNAIELYFWTILAMYALYTLRAALQIVARFGRFAPRT